MSPLCTLLPAQCKLEQDPTLFVNDQTVHNLGRRHLCKGNDKEEQEENQKGCERKNNLKAHTGSNELVM